MQIRFHKYLTPAVFLLLFFIASQKGVSAVSITVSGNGAESTSVVSANTSQQLVVQQDNQANVTNNISASTNTGNNQANANTGGDVAIDTGDATTSVTVTNAVNQSVLDALSGSVSQSNHQTILTSLEVFISGNGADSHNQIDVNRDNTRYLTQNNRAAVTNNVDANANTGGNEANRNTGGAVNISTGDASTSVSVRNDLNRNQAVVACGCIGAPTVDPEPEPTSEPPLGPEPVTLAAVPTTTTTAKTEEDVLSDVVMLPATGSASDNWSMIYALMMIALGFYMKKKIETWYHAYYKV